MTETTRSPECRVFGVTLMLAFELGSTKWTLGFTTAPAQRPRLRTIAAGDLAALEKEIQLAKVRFGLPREAPVRSCDEAGRDGFWLHRFEHRSQSAGAPGEDGSAGCRQLVGPAPGVARRGTQGLACGARPVAR